MARSFPIEKLRLQDLVGAAERLLGRQGAIHRVDWLGPIER